METNPFKISPEEFERAVQYVRKELSPDLIGHIKYRIRLDPKWLDEQQYGIGHDIRNLLRRGGFAWGDQALYAEWKNIIDDAVNRGNQ